MVNQLVSLVFNIIIKHWLDYCDYFYCVDEKYTHGGNVVSKNYVC